jgi:hypothetical protein
MSTLLKQSWPAPESFARLSGRTSHIAVTAVPRRLLESWLLGSDLWPSRAPASSLTRCEYSVTLWNGLNAHSYVSVVSVD